MQTRFTDCQNQRAKERRSCLWNNQVQRPWSLNLATNGVSHALTLQNRVSHFSHWGEQMPDKCSLRALQTHPRVCLIKVIADLNPDKLRVDHHKYQWPYSLVDITEIHLRWVPSSPFAHAITLSGTLFFFFEIHPSTWHPSSPQFCHLVPW